MEHGFHEGVRAARVHETYRYLLLFKKEKPKDIRDGKKPPFLPLYLMEKVY
jgi:hypothetical protein